MPEVGVAVVDRGRVDTQRTAGSLPQIAVVEMGSAEVYWMTGWTW